MGLILSENLASVHKSIEVEARVVPGCRHCGQAASLHELNGHGYDPRANIDPLETVAFTSRDPIANILWQLEQFFRRIRFYYIRSH